MGGRPFIKQLYIVTKITILTFQEKEPLRFSDQMQVPFQCLVFGCCVFVLWSRDLQNPGLCINGENPELNTRKV